MTRSRRSDGPSPSRDAGTALAWAATIALLLAGVVLAVIGISLMATLPDRGLVGSALAFAALSLLSAAIGASLLREPRWLTAAHRRARPHQQPVRHPLPASRKHPPGTAVRRQ